MSKETINTEQSADENAETLSLTPVPTPVRAEDLDERLKAALAAAADKKALDPVVLDLRAIANFTDFFG